MEANQSVVPGEKDRRHPPRDFRSILKQLGPGLIISASIVGSGELIATTTLGAHVGLAALWLIILSCLIKVVVQQELARYTISSGETSFQALNRVPGPRWKASWVVWAWMLMFCGVTFQSGGILGGLGQVFNLALPQLSVDVWTVITAVTVGVLLFGQGYRNIEKISIFMVVSFTFITVACAVLLTWTPHRISPREMLEGFHFRLPDGGPGVAFAAFGITGVGATELIYYPYWCLEKGYARFAGRNTGSPDWVQRSHGWVRVMQIDTIFAMVIYTVTTVAFYILGARILYGMGNIPAGYSMVETLSSMYTETLGAGAFYLFLLGALFVLYSTIFAGTAANSRVLVDFLDLVGLVHIRDEERRLRWQRVMVVALLVTFTFWHSLIGQPVFMVVIGGIFQACLLPVLGFSAIYLRYKHTDCALRPAVITDMLLWVSSTLMLGFAVWYLVGLV